MTPTDEIRGAANRIQSRAPRRAELVAFLEDPFLDKPTAPVTAEYAPDLRHAVAELANIDAQDAIDGRILATTSAIIDGSRPERLVHRALKNLMNEWGLTKDGVVGEILKLVKVDGEAAVTKWMNSETMRQFVSKVVRETVKTLVEPTLKTEVRAFLDRRIKLKADITATVTPEEPSEPV